MPHIDEEELRQMEERDDFINSGQHISMSLSVKVAVPFKLANTSGRLTLLEAKRKMYGWGGCGNCLGNGVRILIESAGSKEELEVGPQPRLYQHKGLRMALGSTDTEKGTAVIFIDDGQ